MRGDHCSGSALPGPFPDHPRVRGDHEKLNFHLARQGGPPPRGRRRPGDRAPRGDRVRTTPRGAGTTIDIHDDVTELRGPPPRGGGSTTGDVQHRRHMLWTTPRRTTPRGRGDNGPTICADFPYNGPPPRARGPPVVRGPGPGHPGTTPAGAGTKLRYSLTGLARQDHPSGCGDHRNLSTFQTDLVGPPPPVRGPLGRVVLGRGRVRTTPAGEGTTPADLGVYFSVSRSGIGFRHATLRMFVASRCKRV